MRYAAQRSWPVVLRDPRAMLALKPPYLGLDFEWNPKTKRIGIVGVSDGTTTVSCPWDDESRENLRLLLGTNLFNLVGHNLLQAEFPALERDGIFLTRDYAQRSFDTIVMWYLTHAHLCKAKSKGEDDAEGRGFMALWHMASACTSLPYWKDCRESPGSVWRRGRCDGPCPKHDVFGYCGTDSLAPVLALPELQLLMRTRRVEHLYPLHVDLMLTLDRIRDRGVRIDTVYVASLRAGWAASVEAMKGEWKAAKCLREGAFPFNPESPKQVIAYFKERGITLPDCTEETIRAEAEASGDTLLCSLLEYKELGDGPDRWFGDKYVDADGYVHPRLNPYTSSGRLACVSPNFQNVAKRRIDRATGENVGKRMRRAVIAPEGYALWRADWKSAENLVYLWLAGYRDLPTDDLHSWMVANIGLTEADEFSVKMGSARDAAKSVTHSTDYNEGLQLLEPAALRSPRIKREIEVGARVVCPDWTFAGKTVSFTGINLAQRAWGSKSFEHRKRALSVQQKYLARFPLIRELQKRISVQCERDGAVRTPHGYHTASFGDPVDRMKIAAAIWGSNPVAHFSKIALLRAEQSSVVRPVLQVHDELIFYAPTETDPERVRDEIVEIMDTRGTDSELRDLRIPVDVSHGANWADQVKLEREAKVYV